MITKEQVLPFIHLAFAEDVREGDHSSLACIPQEKIGRAHLLVKDQGIIAGIQLAKWVFDSIDPTLKVSTLLKDGDTVKKGDIAFTVEGCSVSILTAERLVLNCMQRMSAIATKTKDYVALVEGTNTTILDTRKTTPGIRILEKWAVRIGGGANHRFGLYDMIMLKDNHLDYAGGIIVTDWFSDGGNSDQMKITVRFLTNEIRSDAINIIVHKKICDNQNNCKVNKIENNLNNKIKFAILKKATQLQGNALAKKKEGKQPARLPKNF